MAYRSADVSTAIPRVIISRSSTLRQDLSHPQVERELTKDRQSAWLNSGAPMYATDLRPLSVDLKASAWAPGLEKAMRNECG